MPKSDFRFSHTLRVRWAECDPQGIAFNGAFLTWMEVAQAEYWRNLGVNIYELAKRNEFDTALVSASQEYASPANLDDLLDIHARILRIGTTSIKMEFEVYRSNEGTLLATMSATYVNYDSAARSSRPVPENMRTLAERYEETGGRHT